jgi:hypothetical protein
VVMIGLGAREPVRNTALYADVTRAHVADAGGDGRLTVVVDPATLLGRVQARQEAGETVFRLRGHEGDAVVACLGRAGILPSAVEPLAGWARSLQGQVDGEMMHDDRMQYLGYRAQFTAVGESYGAEITGAASRALPAELFGRDDLRRAAREWGQETPPETGTPPGGYLDTALQAHRYLTARDAAWTGLAAGPAPVPPRPATASRRRPGPVPGRASAARGRPAR